MRNTGRLLSLDALRGFDMLFIMGFSDAVVQACALFGAQDCWLSQQMTHVAWHGLRQHDTIFPLFLFLAGVSWPFSRASAEARNVSGVRLVRKILKRTVLLVLLGIVWGGFQKLDFANWRYDSVLAHIGICWAGATLIHLMVKDWRVYLGIAFALLVGHWLVLFLATAPDMAALLASTDPAVAAKVAAYADTGNGGFSFVGNFAGWVDRMLMPGRLHEIVFDPDGLFSKISGTALAMLGVLAGMLLRGKWSGNRKTAILFAAAAVAAVAALAWSPVCPVNKKIWTASFVLATGAYSLALLAAFYWIVDVRGWSRWTFFFRVIGMNSLTIYLAQRFVGFGRIRDFFLKGLILQLPPDCIPVVNSLTYVAVCWLFLYLLYRKGMFLKV